MTTTSINMWQEVKKKIESSNGGDKTDEMEEIAKIKIGRIKLPEAKKLTRPKLERSKRPKAKKLRSPNAKNLKNLIKFKKSDFIKT